MKNPITPRAEQNLEAQIRVASRLKESAADERHSPAPFITLSRQFGCEAVALAEAVAAQLDAGGQLESGSWQVYSRKLIEAMADQEYSYEHLMSALGSKSRGAIEEFMSTLFGQISDLKLMHKLVRTIRATATLGRCIIVGRGAAVITRDMPGGIHVRLVASKAYRLRGLIERHGWTEAAAREALLQQDRERAHFYEKYLQRDSSDPELYDLVLNAGSLTQAQMADQIVTLYRARRLAQSA